MAQALPHSVMYHNHHPQQQAHYLPNSQSQYYVQYPQYGVQSSSMSASSYAASTQTQYSVNLGMDGLGGNASVHPGGVDRTARMDRRRPKYTRSKLGCLTCRRKKVKCDEAKPTCTRCTNAGLGCTWPDPPPPKKKGSSSRSTSKRSTDSPVSPTEPESSSTSAGLNPNFSFAPESDSETSRPTTAHLDERYKLEGGSGDEYATPHAQFFSASASISERRHSEPHFSGLVPQGSAMGIDVRRHSTVEGLTMYQAQQHNQDAAVAPGALGLTLNQLHAQEQVKAEGQTPALSYSSLASHSGAESRNGSRPGTPNDFYAQQQQIGGQNSAFPAAGHNGWALGISLPNISCTSTANSSRPSTASSLSLSHVNALRRASATSFGTGGGSPPTTGGSVPQGSPFSYQMSKPYGDMSQRSSIDMTATGMAQAQNMVSNGNYTTSRPSTANSFHHASTSMNMQNTSAGDSPFGRRGSLDGRVHVPSPLLNQSSSPLAQPQPSHTPQGYFMQVNPFPSANIARSESPWGTRTY